MFKLFPFFSLFLSLHFIRTFFISTNSSFTFISIFPTITNTSWSHLHRHIYMLHAYMPLQLHEHVYFHTSLHAYMPRCISTWIYEYMHMSLQANMLTCLHVYMSTCTHATHIHFCMCTCQHEDMLSEHMSICPHIYIHTCIFVSISAWIHA